MNDYHKCFLAGALVGSILIGCVAIIGWWFQYVG